MAKLLKRSLIVLVPTVIGLMITWLGQAIASRGHVSPEVSWIVAYGAPVLLIMLTGWMSVRYGELRCWSAAFAGALVYLLGRVLPLTVVALHGTRPGLSWLAIGGIIVAVVVLLPVLLSLGYLGAWIATRESPRPRSA